MQLTKPFPHSDIRSSKYLTNLVIIGNKITFLYNILSDFMLSVQ